MSDFVANVVDGMTSAANAVGETVTNVITAGDDDEPYHNDPPVVMYRPDVAEVITQVRKVDETLFLLKRQSEVY